MKNYTLISYPPPRARIVEYPAHGGETCIDYTFVGNVEKGTGNPPFTYEWDFSYDEINFNVDKTGEIVNWSYNLGDLWYTVALRVTDDSDREDIDTQIFYIEKGYDFVVTDITVNSTNGWPVKENERFWIYAKVNNDDSGWTPSYEVFIEVYHMIPWYRYKTFDRIFEDPLPGYGDRAFETESYLIRDGDHGWYIVYVEVFVDGVELEQGHEDFWIWND